MSPLGVGLGRPQPLAGPRHIQHVGVEFGRHGELGEEEEVDGEGEV